MVNPERPNFDLAFRAGHVPLAVVPHQDNVVFEAPGVIFGERTATTGTASSSLELGPGSDDFRTLAKPLDLTP
jgi:hypothetical protein